MIVFIVIWMFKLCVINVIVSILVVYCLLLFSIEEPTQENFLRKFLRVTIEEGNHDQIL